MGASSVLIDQTTLCEAARLLEGVSTPMARRTMGAVTPGTAERLAHLSTLLDALLLYDEVRVLDAQLPSDAEQLTLRRVLLDRRILRYVDTRALSVEVSEELTHFLRAAEAGPRQSTGLHSHPYASADEVGRSVRQLLDHAPASQSDGLVHALHSDVEGDLAHWWIGKWAEALHADPVRILGTETLHFIGYWSSGAITGGVSHLRTFVYWRTAAHLRIPFLPSLRRLPVYHLMTDHVRRTVQDRVYEVVADSFRATVAEVYEDEEPLALYLPPALSLFLDHLRAHGDIAAAVDALRHQHRRLRRSLAELQQTLDTSSSLGEARAARKRLKAALETLRADLDPGDRTAGGTVDQLIEIVPGVVKAAANPLDVGGYADALLARPSDWIRSWWLRRPVRSALRLSTRLEDLSRYDRLLEEATGHRCDPAEVEALRRSYGRELELYGGDSRLPSAPPWTTAAEPSEQEPA
ncbi:hypothetical protein OG864_18765 [Streptomyces sp. NBC_00124]|uniref:hypothetical protein n=1 Tax=Streptomyces sp. NBC_00124 TaxID=2975662 RepID=UPI002254FAD8|nr:hypothetical protein [Streptomyces sp. NBC_00124]MCX5360749.1 hypothetical protein [Streptomyces sp. NBC_00124]